MATFRPRRVSRAYKRHPCRLDRGSTQSGNGRTSCQSFRPGRFSLMAGAQASQRRGRPLAVREQRSREGGCSTNAAPQAEGERIFQGQRCDHNRRKGWAFFATKRNAKLMSWIVAVLLLQEIRTEYLVRFIDSRRAAASASLYARALLPRNHHVADSAMATTGPSWLARRRLRGSDFNGGTPRRP